MDLMEADDVWSTILYATARYTLATKQDLAFIQDWLYFKAIRFVNVFTKHRFFIQYCKYPKRNQSCYYN